MPDKAADTVENQIQELQQITAKRFILVVLDGVYSSVSIKVLFIPLFFISLSDMWDAEHERPFSCIDPATASKLLVVRWLGGKLMLFSLKCSLLSDDSHQRHYVEGYGSRSGTTRSTR